MNSYGGFVSHYRDCFAQERRYIIKGGPGCGKSTLMRRIAHEAEQRGLEVEYYELDVVIFAQLVKLDELSAADTGFRIRIVERLHQLR